MLHALKKLRERNYIIALDDFELTPDTEEIGRAHV